MSRFAKLDARASVPAPAAKPVVVTASARTSSREGKRGITIWVSEETRVALGKLALDEKTSTQALIFEALDMLARSRSKHPFGEGSGA